MFLNPIIQKIQEDRLKTHGYLTVAGAALFVGVSKSTIRYWDKKKKIVSFRNPINDYRLYKIDDLNKVLDSIK